MAKWTARDMPDQTGRTIVVTGANSGLGLVTSRELARRGARVIMAVRSVERGEEAAGQIRDAVPEADLDVRRLDLGDLASVREFAAGVDGPLDVLVNNAGIMMPPRSETADGFETQIGTNHLGHFALTGLLMEALERATAARVVTITSIEHYPGHIDFDDLLSRNGYSPRKAYQQSKLANALFAAELDRRLRATGSSVISVLAHPGYSDTNLQSAGPTGLMKLLLAQIGNRLVAQSAGMGALPQLYAATAGDVQGGDFIAPDGRRALRGHPTRVKASREAREPEVARRLWDVSEDLTGVSYMSRSSA